MRNFMSLEGNLGSDPKLIKTENGSFISLNLAQNYKVGDEQKTSWYEVAVFNENLKKISEGLKKGDRVAMSGTISSQKKEIGQITVTLVKLAANRINKIERISLPGTPSEETETNPAADDMPNFSSHEEVSF